MNDADWEARTKVDPVFPDGESAITFGYVPEEQQDEFESQLAECQVEIGELRMADTDADLERWYVNLSEQHRCIEAKGYALEVPPSLDTFIDEYRASAAIRWYPARAISDPDEYVEVLAACPLEWVE